MAMIRASPSIALCVGFATAINQHRINRSSASSVPKFLCARLRQLDKRDRAKYGMSMMENLERIRDMGLDEFVAHERVRWVCAECGGILCVHRTDCISSGASRSVGTDGG